MGNILKIKRKKPQNAYKNGNINLLIESFFNLAVSTFKVNLVMFVIP